MPIQYSDKKVVVFGKGLLGIQIANYLQAIEKEIVVVPATLEPEWSPSLSSHCREANIPMLTWDEFNKSQDTYPLGISIYFDKIFKESHIARFKTLLNVHNSALPRYRGVNPVNWALKNGEKSHGVTLHQVEVGIDTGPIFGQKIFGIDPNVLEVEDLYQLCLTHAYSLFCETFPKLDQITPVAQDELRATYFARTDFEKLGERMSPSREK